MLTGLFWGAVDGFAGLFNGFNYIFTSGSTSKADKFDNFVSMKKLNMPLIQRVMGYVLRDMKKNKTSRQKRVQLAGLGG